MKAADDLHAGFITRISSKMLSVRVHTSAEPKETHAAWRRMPVKSVYLCVLLNLCCRFTQAALHVYTKRERLLSRSAVGKVDSSQR